MMEFNISALVIAISTFNLNMSQVNRESRCCGVGPMMMIMIWAVYQ